MTTDLKQTFAIAKASILSLFNAIERLELALVAAIDPDAPCSYVPTPKALAGGSLPSSPADDEGGLSSFLTPPPDAAPGEGKGGPHVISTEGGNVTIENGKITNAWCSNCKRGGQPRHYSGCLWCICGHLIADTADLAAAYYGG
ncbi:MAG: hypothetical protein JXA14_26260 [Anaerolineae bacterium]|nr:hypothetical protein [Anaerolineae bacterium]